MNFKFINSLLIFVIFFLSSCNSTVNKSSDKNEVSINNNKIKESQNLDFESYNHSNNNIQDFYSSSKVNLNFLSKDLKKLKINNYENRYNNNPLRVLISDQYIYSLNYKSELLKFNLIDGKLIDRINIDYSLIENKLPVSFSIIDNDFVVGYKDGTIIRVNKSGVVIWFFNKNKILNTQLKINENFIIALYSDSIVLLSNEDGNIIIDKKYNGSNIIQSSGGKIIQYFNIIFFILPNSSFGSIDTLLIEKYKSAFLNSDFENSLNNLNDNLHVYKNNIIYIDNGDILNTFNLKDEKLILDNLSFNSVESSVVFNNTFIVKNKSNIKFYNIINGDLFFKVNIEKKIKGKFKLLKVMNINEKIHIFTNQGQIIIVNKNKELEDIINLKIKNINNVYSYANKIFISTEKGKTYIFG